MQRIRHIVLGFLLIGGWIPQTVLSKTLTLVNSSGESVELGIAETEPFLDVLDRIQFYFQEEGLTRQEDQELDCSTLAQDLPLNNSQFDFAMSYAGVTVRSKKTNERDYKASVTKSEKEDISYIVNTLAYDGYLSIGAAKSSLEKSGKRIEHIHPLRFLMTIFTDEKLKAGIHAIRDRGGWLWSKFIDGTTKSLQQESDRQNLLQFVDHFSQKVNIDPTLITPVLKQGKWNHFVDILIDTIPREVDPKRYDM